MPVTLAPVGPYQVNVTLVDLANPAGTIVPSNTRADGELFPFQRDIALELSKQKSAALIARSGVGKMEIAIAAARTHLTPDSEVERVVILTNPNLVSQWAREITKTTLPADVFDAYATREAGERWRNYSAGAQRWTVVPYSLLINDTDVLLTTMNNSLLLIDAMFQVKNPEAQRSVATLALAKAAAHRLTLLSTPQNYMLAQWHHVIKTALDPNETDPRSLDRAVADSYQMIGEHHILTITQ